MSGFWRIGRLKHLAIGGKSEGTPLISAKLPDAGLPHIRSALLLLAGLRGCLLAMAEAPTLSETSKRSDTINWLSHRRLITSSPEEALKHCPEDFAGVPDLLPFLRDDGVDNLKAVLEEVLPREPRDNFKLRSVGRIKQQMCEAVGDTAKPDVEEVEGKLQKIERLADCDWTNNDELAEIVSEKMSFHHEGVDKQRGTEFIKKLYLALAGDGTEEQNVRHARQLKLVGPSNNGKRASRSGWRACGSRPRKTRRRVAGSVFVRWRRWTP